MALPEPEEEPEANAEERQSVLVGYGPSRAKVARRPRKPGVRLAASPTAPPGRQDKPYTTPPVRLRAPKFGIDLAVVTQLLRRRILCVGQGRAGSTSGCAVGRNGHGNYWRAPPAGTRICSLTGGLAPNLTAGRWKLCEPRGSARFCERWPHENVVLCRLVPRVRRSSAAIACDRTTADDTLAN